MATVYLGRVSGEGGFERLVAIKLMHAHIATQPEFVPMFLDEARLAARIRHPNVVPYLAVERSPEGLFLVMEFVEGYPLHVVLRWLLRNRVQMPPGIALRIALDLLEGLHAAHELRDANGRPLMLVHRDVSPQNVLLGKDGVAKITDFGVAHARSRLSSTEGSSLKGKVGYLSPEQVIAGTVDRRADVFAAGIVLWEMLTGRRLFRGETEGQTIALIIGGARKSPRQKNPNIPESISAVCMHALAPEPIRRFQTAIEFADALEIAARSANVQIAKQRDLGTFLADLRIPEQPPDAKTLASSSEIWAKASGSDIAPQTGSGASMAEPMVSSMRAPRARGPLVAIAVVLAVMLGIGIGLLALKSISGARSDELQPAARSPDPPKNAEPTPPPPKADPAASAVAEEKEARAPEKAPEPPPSASASASAKAAETKAKAKEAAEAARRAAAAAAATAPPKPPRSSGAGYRPDSL
jgi:serine/threonine-protein kinase